MNASRSAGWRRFLAASLIFGAAVAGAGNDPDRVMRDGFEGIVVPALDDAEAARFLHQASFGPTLADIAHLRTVGYATWLTEQKNATPSLQLPYLDWVKSQPNVAGVFRKERMEAWLINSLGTADPSTGNPVHADQLRQRVAFALSQIFVVSDQHSTLAYFHFSLAGFYDTLALGAFGNFRDLLEDVTRHPAMGVYLSMAGNQKPNPALNLHPDENYAREVLQLFSIGLAQLNPDGTPKLAAGQPIPTYRQDAIRGFASVFTGWNFGAGQCNAVNYTFCTPLGPNDADKPAWRVPMEAVAAFHDTAGPEVDVANQRYKQLLDYPGVSLPNGRLYAGGTAQSDLDAALDNIFHHPNVGPFISRQLIQRLVTSNPTPAYVQRVAAKFDDNGAGVRGDLWAVIEAILLDTEARGGHLQDPDTFGKPREPMLRLANLWRATKAYSQSGRLDLQPTFQTDIGQVPQGSPTVFNFYRPGFQQAGEIRTRGLASPEFQVFTDTQLATSPNDFQRRIFDYYPGATNGLVGPQTLVIDPGPAPLGNGDGALAANPDALLDRYDLLFFAGRMSPATRNALRTRLQAMGNGHAGRDRVQQALFLIMVSPEFAAQK